MKKYSSKYFLTTSTILEKQKIAKIATMRFFCFQDNTCLSGIEYLKIIIKKEKAKGKLKGVKFLSLDDGTIIQSSAPVLVIIGQYNRFAYLENIIDGILSRMSSIATNCMNYIKAAQNKEIIFMADRSDYYKNQPLDGYSAYIGGMRSFVTKAQLELLKNKKDAKYVGTMPHALIQQNQGDLIKAIEVFLLTFPNKPVIALIDYHNDCLKEIDLIANSKFKDKVTAVRVDTSKSVIDHSLKNHPNHLELYGVNHELILLIRKKLDEKGMHQTKIIATSGINIDNINEFNKLNTPVDIYGIGSALIKNSVHFAGDLIKINDKYESKFGRNKNIEKELLTLKKW
ncbi:MAG: nicotinate phosphoribosyltransferase [Mycoplasmoidaceae bacterium]